MERSISYNHLPSRPEHSWQEYSHAHTKSAADKNGNAAKNTPQQRSSMPQQRPTSVAGTTVMVPNTGQRPPQLLDAIAPSPLDRRSKFAEEEAERLSLEREARKQAAKEAEENKTHLKTRIGAKIGPDDEFRGGRYVVRKLLGKGVYGKVFECDDLKYDGCLVAVKIVRDLPEFKAAGLNEIKVLKTLNGACGLLRMCRDFFHFNHVGISVDLYGESLHAKLARVGTFTMAQVADVGLQLLHGVQYMHKCGIVHTDLKPENILMYHRPDPNIGKEDDDVKNPVCVRIVDLGSAVFEKGWHQPEIGTQEYRPPEVVLQTGWSYETDLWAIGCILVELLTGKKLFFESMDQNVHLMLMEKCLGKKIPQTLLRKAWQSGAARQSKMLVPSTYPASGHTQLEINPLTKDVLQRKKLREGYLLSEAVSNPLLKDLLDTLLQFEAHKRSKAGPLRKHDFFKLARFDRSNIDVLTPYPPIFPPESPLYRPLDSSPTQDRPLDNPQDRTNSFPLDLSGASRSKKEEKIVQMQKLAENFRQQYERDRHSPNDAPGLRPDMPDIQTESLQQAERLLEQLKLQVAIVKHWYLEKQSLSISYQKGSPWQKILDHTYIHI
jgi:dual-specificity kinase